MIYIVTDSNGLSTAAHFNIVLIGGPTFSALPGNRTYAVGSRRVSWQLPLGIASVNYPNNVLLYSVSGPNGESLADAMPGGGASFDADPGDRRISIHPNRAGVFPLVYRIDSAASANGVILVSREATFTVTILGPNIPIAETPRDRSYAAGAVIVPFTLPAVTVGHAPFTYRLTGAGRQSLDNAVPGVVFDAASRVLSGIPTRAEANVPLTYRITDASGRTSRVTFDISITGPDIEQNLVDRTYTFGQARTQTFPTARGAAHLYCSGAE